MSPERREMLKMRRGLRSITTMVAATIRGLVESVSEPRSARITLLLMRLEFANDDAMRLVLGMTGKQITKLKGRASMLVPASPGKPSVPPADSAGGER